MFTTDSSDSRVSGGRHHLPGVQTGPRPEIILSSHYHSRSGLVFYRAVRPEDTPGQITQFGVCDHASLDHSIALDIISQEFTGFFGREVTTMKVSHAAEIPTAIR
jgi:hypothetical protein